MGSLDFVRKDVLACVWICIFLGFLLPHRGGGQRDTQDIVEGKAHPKPQCAASPHSHMKWLHGCNIMAIFHLKTSQTNVFLLQKSKHKCGNGLRGHVYLLLTFPR